MLKLSVVVPCYDEENGMRELHRRVSSVCWGCVGKSYELVFVNDGSRDTTWQVMKDISDGDEQVVCHQFVT